MTNLDSRPPCLGSYSVDGCIKHLREHPGWGPTLYFSASGICRGSLSIVQLPMLACGERVAMVVAPPPTHDSAVSSCFHGGPAFFHRHFPPQSPPSHPFNPSLRSQQQPSLHRKQDCSTIPKLQLPAATPSRGSATLSWICMAVEGLILIPFRLPRISSFTLSLKCFSSDSDNCSHVGIGPLVQFPHLPRVGPVLLTLLFFLLVPQSY